MHEIVQKVVADIERKARAQVDDKPIAQRTVGQSVTQSWGEDDRQKKDQMERQWIEDEKVGTKKSGRSFLAGRSFAEGA